MTHALLAAAMQMPPVGSREPLSCRIAISNGQISRVKIDIIYNWI